MRALAWISAAAVCLLASPPPSIDAQDTTAATAADTSIAPLRAWIFPSEGGSVRYDLSDSAFVAVFALYSYGGVRLLSGPAQAEFPEPAGFHLTTVGYAALGEDGYQRASGDFATAGTQVCLFLVASRRPLHVDQYSTQALASVTGQRIISAGQLEQGLDALLDPVGPADRGSWATDLLCGDLGSWLTLGRQVERPFGDLNDAAYDLQATSASALQTVPQPYAVSVCVVRAADRAGGCRVPGVPGHEPPFRPRGTTDGSAAGGGVPSLVHGGPAARMPVRARTDVPVPAGHEPVRRADVPAVRSDPTGAAQVEAHGTTLATTPANASSSSSTSTHAQSSAGSESRSAEPNAGSSGSGESRSSGNASSSGASYGGASSRSSGGSYGGASSGSYGGSTGGSSGGGASGSVGGGRPH
jgi:hypothetical protein